MPLTHILNEEGECLCIHLGVSEAFQGLPKGYVVMVHGSTGSLFGWVPRDFQAHFSGQDFHVSWLQWVVSYANSASINLGEQQVGKANLYAQCSLILLARKKRRFHMPDPKDCLVVFGQADSQTNIPHIPAFMSFG